MVGLIIIAIAAPLYVAIFALFNPKDKGQRGAFLLWEGGLSAIVGGVWLIVAVCVGVAHLTHAITQWFLTEERITITAGGQYVVKSGQYIFSNANAVQLLSVIGQAIFAGISVFLTSIYVFFTWRALRQQRNLSAKQDRSMQSQAVEQASIVERQIEATLQSSKDLSRIADNLEAIARLLNLPQTNPQSPGGVNSNGQSPRH